MTANELCMYEVDMVGGQLRKAVEGMTDAEWDQTCDASSMSARETFVHLAECYVAAAKQLNGEEHEWGSYTVSDNSPAAALAAFEAERGKVVGMIRGSEDEKHLHTAVNFISQHDAYHVGQLCSMRLKFNPDWNAYAIYE
jgi:uncharacterized damage-inducible protein DinB